MLMHRDLSYKALHSMLESHFNICINYSGLARMHGCHNEQSESINVRDWPFKHATEQAEASNLSIQKGGMHFHTVQLSVHSRWRGRWALVITIVALMQRSSTLAGQSTSGK